MGHLQRPRLAGEATGTRETHAHLRHPKSVDKSTGRTRPLTAKRPPVTDEPAGRPRNPFKRPPLGADVAQDVYEKIFQVAKRRGFLYPAYEIYGGIAGFYDYGPLGAALKANMENTWRRFYVTREGCAEIACPAVTPEEVFEASGHVAEFTDPMVTCNDCSSPFRADHLIEAAGYEGVVSVTDMDEVDTLIGKHGVKCPTCGGAVGSAYRQNLMFNTEIGPGSKRRGFLRPETAQGIFVDFNHLYRYFREKLPFGVVQLGRGYRNEISPRQGMIRLREFNMMEAEIFVDPEDGKSHPDFDNVADRRFILVDNETEEAKEHRLGDAVSSGVICNEALGYYMALTYDFLVAVGLKHDGIRFRQHLKTEMAHYANDCWDAEFHSARFGWVECVGIADRSAYDLAQHEKHSKVSLRAMRKYDELREETRDVVFPIGKVLGPLFKGDAKAVGEAMKELDASTVTPGQTLTVTVGDASHDVPPEAYEVKSVTEKVAGVSFTPHVIEPSYGLDRILYAALEHSYSEEESKDEDGKVETYRRLRLPAGVAPIKAGIFPLIGKEGLPEQAREIDRALRAAGISTQYDDTGSVGRRYARQDEIGTPYCITVDFDTLGKGDDASLKGTVTVRERDTSEQVRVKIDELAGWLHSRVN